MGRVCTYDRPDLDDESFINRVVGIGTHPSTCIWISTSTPTHKNGLLLFRSSCRLVHHLFLVAVVDDVCTVVNQTYRILSQFVPNSLTIFPPLFPPFTFLSCIQSLGRVGLIGCGLGGVWGIHFLLLVQLIFHRIGLLRWEETERLLGQDRIQLLMQYAGYVVLVCSFHMAEFFTTAVYNPSVLNANSFIISQSPAYTAAAIVSVDTILVAARIPVLRHATSCRIVSVCSSHLCCLVVGTITYYTHHCQTNVPPPLPSLPLFWFCQHSCL